MLDWADVVGGKFFRPIKQPISIRVDADVLAWFKAQDGRYQARMRSNHAIANYPAATRLISEEELSVARKRLKDLGYTGL